MSDRLWSDDSENSGSNSSGRRVGTVQMYKLKYMLYHFGQESRYCPDVQA